jgi:predicted 2-oxoglutarate/Fe(II)-dependent dioxygenase YbiX
MNNGQFDQPIFWNFASSIPKDLIDIFLKEAEVLPVKAGRAGSGKIGAKEFRKVSVQTPDEFNFMSLLLTSYAFKANARCWRYDLWGSIQADLLTYHADTNDKYDGHVDTLHLAEGVCRKLTAVAILNDDYEGGRFFLLQSEGNKQYIETPTGTVLIFPSHIMHGVEPVTSGVRKSLATWLIGPSFK